jgi:glycosyltransferase involved in cell wall biosynthesis
LRNGSDVVSNIERHCGQMADSVVTVSYAMKDKLTELDFPQEKIRVCYNVVDPEKYSMKQVSEDEIRAVRQRYGIGDDDLMVYFVGRITGYFADRLT